MMTRTVLAAVVALFAASAASPAWAQRGGATSNDPTTLRIPKPTGEPKATPITSIMTAMLLGGGLVVLTLLPSKRGHQD